ncbi:GumC family protein [Actibacterium ureilyticum]|uniref:GumC family protein n=1 Tax=Actibacterium ureilyticum TaxID=1590614 RepID=UPI000BAACCD5|nr:lipopolysaccharide biosynthesis [Actibacterium ureilyticum]
MKNDLKYYVAIFMRRLPLFLIVALGLSAAAVALAVSLPTVYSSNTTLLVESAQIPDELASSTVQTNAVEQLEIIEQRLMTRANLIDVARGQQVFEDVDEMTPDQIVRKMRASTEFTSTSGRDRATLMQITFYGRSPKIASGVVNEYVTRILDENVRLRTDQAEDTLEFFRQEVERLGTELGEYSAKIVAFQNENSEALPDSLDYRLTRQSTLQERQAQISRERTTLQDQRERLLQIYESTGQIQASQTGPQTAEERQLQRVREELAAASAVYSDANPKVRVLKTQLEQLERVVAAQQGGEVPTDSETVLQINLAEIDTRMAALDDQADEIAAELSKLQGSISKTPANAISLGALQRDYENIQLQYSAAQERLSKAATGERIELSSKGQRIAVLEQPTVPTEPTSPNRPLIAIGGTTLGLGAGFGLVLLLELLNGAVRRPVELTNALGITPLVTIPYIPTRGQTVRKRSLQFVILALLAAGIPALLYLLHTEYLPLDLLAGRIAERLGL